MNVLYGDVGGQLRAFSWGVRVELHRLGMPSNYFDMELVGSGNAFNSAYNLSEQYEDGIKMRLEWLPSGFWKFFRNDMNHLERGLREVYPLDCSLFSSHRTKVYVALVNRRNLELEFVCLNSSSDPVKLLLSCCAQPILTGPRDYQGGLYYDAGLIAQPALERANKLTAKEVWVLSTTPRGYRFSTAWKWLSLLTMDSQARKLFWDYPQRRNRVLEEIESRPELKVIQPSQHLPIGWRSNDKEGIRRTFELGRKAAQDFARTNGW